MAPLSLIAVLERKPSAAPAQTAAA
jgi:hypothetical protein